MITFSWLAVFTIFDVYQIDTYFINLSICYSNRRGSQGNRRWMWRRIRRWGHLCHRSLQRRQQGRRSQHPDRSRHRVPHQEQAHRRRQGQTGSSIPVPRHWHDHRPREPTPNRSPHRLTELVHLQPRQPSHRVPTHSWQELPPHQCPPGKKQCSCHVRWQLGVLLKWLLWCRRG